MSDTLNALGAYQRGSTVLNALAHPATVNPLQDYSSSIMPLAMLKLMQQRNAAGGGPMPAGAVSGAISALSPQLQGAAAPPTPVPATNVPVRPLPASAVPGAGPGWFMPNKALNNQGNSVYTDPRTGNRWPGLDTHVPLDVLHDLDQSQSGATPQNTWRDSMATLMRDPSDAGVRAMGGALSDQQRTELMALRPIQRLWWAQDQQTGVA